MSTIPSVSHSYATNTSNMPPNRAAEANSTQAPARRVQSENESASPQEPGFMHRLADGVREVRRSVGDAALGMGHMVSTAAHSVLPRVVATPLSTTFASAPRFLGAAATLATSGYRIVTTFNEERKAGSENFPETRKELLMTGAAGAAAVVAGGAIGVAGIGIAALGAPAIVMGGVTVAGFIGVGLVAHKVRGMAAEAFDNYGR